MKTYIKPEFKVENVFSTVSIANDPFDLNDGDGNGEVEVSATDWWDIV